MQMLACLGVLMDNAEVNRHEASAMSIEQVRSALDAHPDIELAIVFGSVASDRAREDSDVDVAVQARRPLDAEKKMCVMADIAVATGRPVDLIDLRTVGEPLLGQILKHGRRIRGSDDDHADLVLRHVFDTEDFMPYVNRMLEERKRAALPSAK